MRSLAESKRRGESKKVIKEDKLITKNRKNKGRVETQEKDIRLHVNRKINDKSNKDKPETYTKSMCVMYM